ncbi:MAG: 30S ribosome-binding factor RbfA [Paracoccaceae bacterium]
MAKTTSSTGQRQLRVGEMIRRNLSEFLAQGAVHDPALNVMSITIGEVKMSPDLKVATVFVMPLLGGAATVADAIAALSKNSYHLRKMVAGSMTLRYAPELRFRADETFDRLDHARKLFADPQVQRDIAAKDEPEAEPEAQ